MRKRIVLPPLPLGEGRGEGTLLTRQSWPESTLTLTLSQRERGLCLYTAIAGAFIFITLLSPAFAQGPESATAVFAGGNYWYLEGAFDKTPGVVKVLAGYTGGTSEYPTYQQVTNGGSGHKMAVEVTYDPKMISYDKLLDVYWHSIDPTDQGGGFCDRGDQYLSAIYYAGEEQKKAADKSIQAARGTIDEKGVATRVLPLQAFYPAEDYHQDYHVKENYKYNFNRKRCRVDEKLKAVWGDEALTEEE